jgi:Xaa-Pro aminopeptidase
MHGFEQLTLAPLDRKLIDVAMLTSDERAYVDAYHAEVLAKVGPLLEGEVLDWLKAQAAPL